MFSRREFPPDFEYTVAAQRVVPGATVQVLDFHWRSEQDVVFNVEKPYLDLALSPRAPGVAGHYVEAGEVTDHRHGEMIFLPAGYRLHSHWRAGYQRCVCCEFDADQLDPGNQVDWGRYELRASLDVRNVFIREAMLRLARELLAPGFNGDILIESLCRVLPIEVPRHFSLLRWHEFGGSNKLEPEQLKRIEGFGSRVYLVNTGWSGGAGGPGGEGQRFPIPVTRAIVQACQSGELMRGNTEYLQTMNLETPRAVTGVDPIYLNPRKAWADPAAYDDQAEQLARLFVNNIAKFSAAPEIVAAGPRI